MNIWLMIWVFLAVLILGTSLWSYLILMRQKRAWASFAEKAGLEYIGLRLMDSAVLRGVYNEFPVNIFSEKQLAGAGSREGGSLRTVIQLSLKSPVPIEGAVASPSFRNFVSGLPLPFVYTPEADGWNKDFIVKSGEKDAFVPYFTKERIAALIPVLSMKTGAAMLLFYQGQILFRFESTDPFAEADRLERFVSKLTETAKILTQTPSPS